MILGLAGDTMLGRKVGQRLRERGPESLIADDVVAAAHEADLFVLNLECVISERGAPWPDPRKPFFFRAPPVAVEVLNALGVSCVTLANNHALDFGPTALLDTLGYLEDAGIRWVGAGAREHEARAPTVLEHEGFRLGVVGVTDHPADFAAGPRAPGVSYADLGPGVPDWLTGSVRALDADADADLRLLTLRCRHSYGSAPARRAPLPPRQPAGRNPRLVMGWGGIGGGWHRRAVRRGP